MKLTTQRISLIGLFSAVILVLNTIPAFLIKGGLGYLTLGDIFLSFLLLNKLISYKDLFFVILIGFGLTDVIMGGYPYILVSILIRLIFVLVFWFLKIEKPNKEISKTKFLKLLIKVFLCLCFWIIVFILGYGITDFIIMKISSGSWALIWNDGLINLVQMGLTVIFFLIFLFLPDLSTKIIPKYTKPKT